MINPLEQVFNVNITQFRVIIDQFSGFASSYQLVLLRHLPGTGSLAY